MKYLSLLSIALLCVFTTTACSSLDAGYLESGLGSPPAETVNVIENGGFDGLNQDGVKGWDIINAYRFSEMVSTEDPSFWDCHPSTDTDAGHGCCWKWSISWWDVQNLSNPYAKFHEYSSACGLVSTRHKVYPNKDIRVTLHYSTQNGYEQGPVEGDELGVRIRWFDSDSNLLATESVAKFSWNTIGTDVSVEGVVSTPGDAKEFDIIVGKITPHNMSELHFDDVAVFYVDRPKN